jgi:hypothetical protein
MIYSRLSTIILVPSAALYVLLHLDRHYMHRGYYTGARMLTTTLLHDMVINPLRLIYTSVLGRIMQRFIHPRPQRVRTSFRAFDFSLQHTVRAVGHPHALSGDVRDQLSSLVDRFVTSTRATTYSVSMSLLDHKTRRAGTRYPYTERDYMIPHHSDAITDAHVLKFVDVDYYADMHYWAKFMRPMVLVTFMPLAPAGSTMDGVYTTNHDGTITSIMTVGTRYTHPLWDHDNDFVCIPHGLFDHYYFVEHRRVADTNYVIVFYNPAYRVLRYVFRPMNPSPTLSRRNDVANGFAVTEYVRDRHVYVSFCRAGRWACTTVRRDYLDSCLDRYRFYPKSFSTATIDLVIPKADGYDTKVHSPSVMDYILAQVPPQRVYTPAADSVTFFPVIDDSEDFEGEKAVMAIPPLSDSAVTSADNLHAEVTAVKHRVTDLQAITTTGPLTGRERSYLSEFVNLIGTAGSLVPYTLEQVLAKQNRATQVAEFTASLPHYGLSNLQAKSFMKREAGKPAPGRVITTVDAEHRTNYSRYTLALAEQLKACPWYAFGLVPTQIAARVHVLGRTYDYLVETDYSKFDGLHSEKMHDVEKYVMQHFFGDSAARTVAREAGVKARTRRGHRYATGFSRLSGSPATSVLNTMCNAFICYVNLRTTFDPETAYANLGIYGGDDGLTWCPDPESLAVTASAYGARLKSVVKQAGDCVSFLGRVYIDPTICDYSIYDLTRFVMKAHIVFPTLLVTPSEALARRACGYRITDSQTPIIREWIQYVSRVGCHADTPEHDQYFAQLILVDGLETFPQAPAGDPLTEAVARRLVGPSFDAYIDQLNTGVFTPEPQVPNVPFPIVYRGELHRPLEITLPPKSTDPLTKSCNAARTSTVRPTRTSPARAKASSSQTAARTHATRRGCAKAARA